MKLVCRLEIIIIFYQNLNLENVRNIFREWQEFVFAIYLMSKRDLNLTLRFSSWEMTKIVY